MERSTKGLLTFKIPHATMDTFLIHAASVTQILCRNHDYVSHFNMWTIYLNYG